MGNTLFLPEQTSWKH